MITHVFVSFPAAQIYELSYIIHFHKDLLSLNIFVLLAQTMFSSPRKDPPKVSLIKKYITASLQ